MESILQALGALFLNALPTFILVIVLHLYMKGMFFKPLERVLKERHEATAGARARAEASLAAAEKKAAEYEEALRQARADLYKEQEETRRQRREEQAAQVAGARAAAERLVADARASIEREKDAARASLEAESEMLASRIADTIFRGRAA